MEIVYWIIGAAAVFALAAVAVGRVTYGLSSDPERAVYDVEESIGFVAEALPSDVTAELSYDDVAVILRLFHEYLHAHGVATTAGEDARAGGPAVVDPDAGVGHVLRRAAAAGVRYRRSDVEAVVDAQLEYFAAIGVVGEPVEPPDDDPA